MTGSGLMRRASAVIAILGAAACTPDAPQNNSAQGQLESRPDDVGSDARWDNYFADATTALDYADFLAEARRDCGQKATQIAPDPEGDARAAMARGDRRYLAIQFPGFRLDGVPVDEQLAIFKRGDFRVIEGLTDDGSGCDAFEAAARHYIRHYNSTLWQLLNPPPRRQSSDSAR